MSSPLPCRPMYFMSSVNTMRAELRRADGVAGILGSSRTLNSLQYWASFAGSRMSLEAPVLALRTAGLRCVAAAAGPFMWRFLGELHAAQRKAVV